MSIPRLTALLLISALWHVGPAWAEDYPAAVQNLLAQGVQVVKSFPAPSGLTGYVVKVRGQSKIVYLTGDRKHLIVGTMLDEGGGNLTVAQLEEHAPKPDYNALWEQARKAAWVAEGAKDPKSVVYVIADPYCPYCHALWLASRPYEQAGLQLRWLLVSYLRTDGEAKAAAILESKDPEAALRRHEQAFAEGGIAPLAHPKPETLRAIQANGTLMEELGATGTPALLYKDADGKVMLSVGMPKLADLAAIFGLPEQKEDDPALARFR